MVIYHGKLWLFNGIFHGIFLGIFHVFFSWDFSWDLPSGELLHDGKQFFSLGKSTINGWGFQAL